MGITEVLWTIEDVGLTEGEARSLIKSYLEDCFSECDCKLCTDFKRQHNI